MDAWRHGYIDTWIHKKNVPAKTQMQGHRDTTIPRYPNTEIQRYRDTEIQRYWVTEIQRHRDTQIQRYRD